MSTKIGFAARGARRSNANPAAAATDERSHRLRGACRHSWHIAQDHLRLRHACQEGLDLLSGKLEHLRRGGRDVPWSRNPLGNGHRILDRPASQNAPCQQSSSAIELRGLICAGGKIASQLLQPLRKASTGLCEIHATLRCLDESVRD